MAVGVAIAATSAVAFGLAYVTRGAIVHARVFDVGFGLADRYMARCRHRLHRRPARSSWRRIPVPPRTLQEHLASALTWHSAHQMRPRAENRPTRQYRGIEQVEQAVGAIPGPTVLRRDALAITAYGMVVVVAAGSLAVTSPLRLPWSYRPMVLRWNRSVNTPRLGGPEHQESKGYTFDRVLIFPTPPVRQYLEAGKSNGPKISRGAIRVRYQSLVQLRIYR